jgi:hypothetical protein
VLSYYLRSRLLLPCLLGASWYLNNVEPPCTLVPSAHVPDALVLNARNKCAVHAGFAAVVIFIAYMINLLEFLFIGTRNLGLA